MAAKKTSKTQSTQIRRALEPEGPVISREEFLAFKNPKGDVIVEIGGRSVALTSLDRIYWPQEKISKFELLSYYLQIWPLIKPFLEDRPAILQRYPRGINAPKFFQHDLQHAPAYVRTVKMLNEQGREIDYAVYTDLPSLLYLVNLGTIEQHPWHSRVQDITHPDWLVLDLDPRGAPWRNVLKVAGVARKVMETRGLRAYPKTSGSSGIHLYLPLQLKHDYEQVADFAHRLAEEIVSRVPELSTVERAIAGRRKGQVYVDWLQNAKGKSMVSPYSVRAKPGGTVSMPLTWENLEQGVKISDFTLKNVPELIQEHGNAWERFFEDRQRLDF